jgi:Ricin-type beta-trefoil lectin domain-like
MKEPELTREAKEAIRAYIIKIVALPGALATVVSFLLGYGIKDIAAKNAELNASQRLENAIASALAKSQGAEEKLKQAEDIGKRIKNLQPLAQALSDAEKLRDTLADQLKKDPDFLKQLTGLPDGSIVRIENLATGTVLDLDQRQGANGTKVQGWQWKDYPNQKWKLVTTK